MLSWNKHKFALYNTYIHPDLHIILLKIHGCKSDQEIKIFNYNIIKINKTSPLHDGAAISVRRYINKKMEKISEETLAITFDVSHEEITIATTGKRIE